MTSWRFDYIYVWIETQSDGRLIFYTIWKHVHNMGVAIDRVINQRHWHWHCALDIYMNCGGHRIDLHSHTYIKISSLCPNHPHTTFAYITLTRNKNYLNINIHIPAVSTPKPNTHPRKARASYKFDIQIESPPQRARCSRCRFVEPIP